MRTNKVKEKHKHGDQVVGTLKGRKALLGFVPSLELFVEAFDQIVGNIVLKALDTNVSGAAENRLDRNIVSRITVGNDRSGRAEFNGFAEQRDGLRRVSVRGYCSPAQS